MIAYERQQPTRPDTAPQFCYYRHHTHFYVNYSGQRTCAECHPPANNEPVVDIVTGEVVEAVTA